MQDKPQHISKKFTDRAWGEMSAMLDQEMPGSIDSGKERRKRRLLWFFLFLVGIGIGAAGAWALTRPSKETVKPNVPVATTQPEIAPAANGHSSIASQADKTSAAVLENNKTVETIINKDRIISPNNSIPENKAQSIPRIAGSKLISPPQYNLPENNNVAKTIEPIQAVDQEALALNELIETRKNLLPINVLPAMNNLALLTTDSEDNKPSLNEIEFPQKRGDINLYVAGMNSPQTHGDGLSAGIALNSNIKNSKFSVQSGVGYSFVRQPLEILYEQRFDSNTSTPSVTDLDSVTYSFEGLSNVKTSGSSNNYQLTSQDLALHYLDIPLSLAYQIQPRFKAYGGVDLSLLLASAPGFTGGSVFNYQVAENTDPVFADQSSLNVKLATFDFAGKLGFRYRIYRSLSFDLSYKHGLSDIIRDNSVKEQNRMVRLGISFRL